MDEEPGSGQIVESAIGFYQILDIDVRTVRYIDN